MPAAASSIASHWDNFASGLERHVWAIVILFLCVVALLLLVWLAAFVVAKIRGKASNKDALRSVFAVAFVGLMNDFRHFLALILVLFFVAIGSWLVFTRPTLDDATKSFVS